MPVDDAVNVCAVVASFHKYVAPAFPAFNVTEPPHLAVSAPKLTTGNAFTVTTTASLAVQLFASVTTTLYVPLVLAVNVCVVALFDHK